jgi:glycosyltransferase involved in cell wall biosynthesis
MNNLPLVSLCIPVFNGAKFIESLFQNIKFISYNNLEVIIVDDCSEDNSWPLIMHNVDKYKNLEGKYIKIFQHKQNQGLVKNWNFCLSKAQGKYIKFLFQDDEITSDCITKMVKIAEMDLDIGLVFCRRKLIYEYEVNPKDYPQNLHLGWTNLQSIQSGLTLLQDKNLVNHPHNKIGEPTNVLIRSCVFNKIGKFDVSFKQYVDLEMWLRIMTTYKIAFIDQDLAFFRVHNQQQTFKNMVQDDCWLEIYEVWLKFLSNNIYEVIPCDIKRKIKQKIIFNLIKEIVKSIFKLRLNNCNNLFNLLFIIYNYKIRSFRY